MITLTDYQRERLDHDINFINNNGHHIEILWEYFGENTAKVTYDDKPVSIINNYDKLQTVVDVLFMLSID